MSTINFSSDWMSVFVRHPETGERTSASLQHIDYIRLCQKYRDISVVNAKLRELAKGVVLVPGLTLSAGLQAAVANLLNPPATGESQPGSGRDR